MMAANVSATPEGARKVLEPCGYIRRVSSKADDLSIVNGARASFDKHLAVLSEDDVRTPEAAAAYNEQMGKMLAGDVLSYGGGRPKQAGIIYRLVDSKHFSVLEQHGLLVRVVNVPVSVLNLITDFVDVRVYDGPSGARASFPWTLNLHHAVDLYRRAMRAKNADGIELAAALLMEFERQGCKVGVDACLRTGGFTRSKFELLATAGCAQFLEGASVSPPTEKDVANAIKWHLGFRGARMTDAEAITFAYQEAPKLLNLYVATWQMRGIIHVFWDLVRHRMSSPNGESGRYSILKDEWVQLSPEQVRTQVGTPLSYQRGVAPTAMAEEFIADLNAFNAEAVALYKKWTKKENLPVHWEGHLLAREMASWFETFAKFRTFVWTFRGMGLLNMLGLRNAPPALHELRLYAAEIEKDVRAEFPLLAAAFDAEQREAP